MNILNPKCVLEFFKELSKNKQTMQIRGAHSIPVKSETLDSTVLDIDIDIKKLLHISGEILILIWDPLEWMFAVDVNKQMELLSSWNQATPFDNFFHLYGYLQFQSAFTCLHVSL